MRVLITGGSGHLGSALAERAPAEAVVVAAGHRASPGRLALDVTDAGSVAAAFERSRPDLVIHCAALTSLGEAEASPAQAWEVNVDGAARVAGAAYRAGARLLAISTDVVFGGDAGPYREDDPPAPVNAYGRSKAAGEEAVHSTHPEALVVRTSVMVGRDRGRRTSFSSHVLESARRGDPVLLYDELRSFVPVVVVALAVWEAARKAVSGFLHIAARQGASRLEFGRALLAAAGLDPLLATPASPPPGGPPRPRDIRLDVTRAAALLDTELPDVAGTVAAVLAEQGPGSPQRRP